MVKKVTSRSERKHRRKRIIEGYRHIDGVRWFPDIYISESKRYARVNWKTRQVC